MAIVGLIPFVYATIKRKRRSMARAADHYAGLATGGAARGHEHVWRGAYQSQSCHFAVLPSPDDEQGFSYGDYGDTRRLSRQLFSADPCERLSTTGAPRAGGRESALFDCGGYHSQSCRFAVRPSPVDELVVSRDSGAFRRPPAQPEGLSLQLLLPDSRHDGLATGAALAREHARSNGSAYQSQSCRFDVRHSAASEHGLSHAAEYSAARTSPGDLSRELLFPAGRKERGVSRSLRFSSMRVFAWVSGA
jgi:hypothetical protein